MSATPSSTPSLSATELAALMAIVGGTAALGRHLAYPALPVSEVRKNDPTYSPLVGMPILPGKPTRRKAAPAEPVAEKDTKEEKTANIGTKVLGAAAGGYGAYSIADWLLEMQRKRDRKALLDQAAQDHEAAIQEYISSSNGVKAADDTITQAQQLQKTARAGQDIVDGAIDILTSLPLLAGSLGVIGGAAGMHRYLRKSAPDPVKEFVARRQLSEQRQLPIILPTAFVPSVDDFDGSNEPASLDPKVAGITGQLSLATGAGEDPAVLGQHLGKDPEMQEFVKSKLNPADIAVGTKAGLKERAGGMFKNVTSMLGM